MSSYDIDRGSSGVIHNYENFSSAEKEMRVGQKVRVKHFSISEYALTEIMEVSENFFKIKITPKMIRSNVFPGDSITVIFVNNENEECLVDGIIEKARAEFPEYFVVRCIRIRKFRDCRKSRRYEIDTCCNITDQESTSFGNVKNISLSGCKVITKAQINERKNMKLEVFLKENKKVLMSAGVARIKKHINYNEYGMTILEMDEASAAIFKEEINNIIKKEMM